MDSPRTRFGVLLAVAAAVLALAAPARADTVTDWNGHAEQALITTAGQGPTVSTIHLAMVHGAVYDAVNAIDRRHEPYLVQPKARRWWSKDAAVAAAAYHVLVSIVPLQQPTLAGHYAASLADIRDGRRKQGGIAVGKAAAEAMIAARADDGRFGPYRFPARTGAGEWEPVLPSFVNDPAAWVAEVDPFLIKSPSQFASDGPDDLDSRKYAREFNEVKSLGSIGSTMRSADQTDAARFWSEGPIIWTRLARDLVARYCLRTADSARLFAMQYLTGADSLIGVWDDKKRWLFWRPIAAIERADEDDNPATEQEVGWRPLINTPPYPDHPSGLSGVIAGMSESFADFFGTDRVWFKASNLTLGIDRKFRSFSQAAREVVDARVWSGIHFRKADEDGARIGKQVSRWRDRFYFEEAD